MLDKRLGPTEWVDAGLKALAKSGFSALKADTLANGLGVSRGSFYWHFADVPTFHAAVLQRWRQVALETIIEDLEAGAGDRLEALLRRAFGTRTDLEKAVRAWATADPRANAAVEAVDAKRIAYLRSLMIEAGAPPDRAETRARLLNWAYLGFVLSPHKLDEETLKNIVGDWSQFAGLPLRRSPKDRETPRTARTSRRQPRS